MANSVQSFKVVLLGECGVGKTCIISQYTKNSFNKNEITTKGAHYSQKDVELELPNQKKEVRIELWDTAGQEKYRTLVKIFYRDAIAIILTYAINVQSSFEALKTYWYPVLKSDCRKDVIICICANKTDLYETEEQVSTEEGKTFAKSINAGYFETSALTKCGIENMFNQILTFAAGSRDTPLQLESNMSEKEEETTQGKQNISLKPNCKEKEAKENKKRC